MWSMKTKIFLPQAQRSVASGLNVKMGMIVHITIQILLASKCMVPFQVWNFRAKAFVLNKRPFTKIQLFFFSFLDIFQIVGTAKIAATFILLVNLVQSKLLRLFSNTRVL